MRFKFFLSFAAIILVTLLSVAYFARQETAQQVQAFIYRGGIYGAEGLVQTLESYYLDHGSWDGVEELFETTGKGFGGGAGAGPGGGRGAGRGAGENLTLYDNQGVLIYNPHNSGSEGNLGPEQLSSAVELIVNGDTAGYLYSPASQDFSSELETNLLERLNQASLNAALIAAGFALLLAIGLTIYLLRPVRSLTSAVIKMKEGNLSQRVDVRGNDEIAALGDAFNQMAAKLEGEQERRQAMTADIAHELRTPLAVQRANLEAMLDGVEPRTDDNIRITLQQNELLERLVADLRTLALADAGELKLELQKTDINTLTAGIIERFQQHARGKGVQLFHSSPKTLPVLRLDPNRTEQILANLLENALRFSPDGGSIMVETGMDEEAVFINVRDSGPGIPEDALPHIFERFYREDNSRSRQGGGTGLGLAIARKLAEAQGGTLTASNHPEGGAIFRLTLPL
jgi:two-component system sensor histidine kinase BaeS